MATHVGHERSITRDDDFNAWLLEQAALLRSRKTQFLDMDGIAEELEAMAKRDERELAGHLKVLLAHLLKFKYQREKASVSWEASAQEAREQIEDILEAAPSLRPKLESFITKAYRRARYTAMREMGGDASTWLARFDDSCPWTFDQFIQESFVPDPIH